MQVTDLQADLRIEVRKPRKVRKELRVLEICLVALYYKVGHERPETVFLIIVLFSSLNIGANCGRKFMKGQ